MEKKFYLPALVIFVLLTFGVNAQRMKFHRITAEIEPQKLAYLFSNGLEIDHFNYENKKNFTAEISDSDLSLLKKNNVKVTYIVEDLEKNLTKYNQDIDKKASKNAKMAVTTPSNFALGSYGGYFTFAELQTILDNMRALYPNLISAKSSIGTTVEGRNVFMVKISDNPDVDEAEPEMFFNAVHHAREPMSMSQLIFFMWHILENYNTDKEIRTLVNSTELYLVPCVNPDGYVYNQGTNPSGGGMWRKNRKNNGNNTYGVDINRNYGFQWGIDNTGSSPTTSSETYRGPSAFSEPETQIIRNFCNAHTFTLSMDFHAYGNYCIHPYGYATTNTNPELSLFQQMGSFFVAENGFVSGNAMQTVAYTANGAGDDWKYGEQTTKGKIYSFTPEIGPAAEGFYPASSRIIPLCNTTVEMNKKAMKVATFFAKVTPTANQTLSSTSGTLTYSIQNFSVKPASYTVSIAPISSAITSVGAAKTYNTLTLLQSQSDNIAFTIDSATPYGTTLQFAITVNNGLSPQTDTVSVMYNCATPNNLATSNVTLNSATLSWGAVAGATSYYVSYKNSASATWSADTLVSSTSFSLNGLTQSQTYNWRVRTSTCSNYSQGNFTTLSPCLAPTTPTTSAITSTSATLNWGAVSGATNYTVEYKLASSATWITATSTNTTTSYALSGLTLSSTYDWRVKANCASGSSTYATGQFTTSSITYCASKGTNLTYMWMDYVQLGSINRTSGKDAGYYNGTALSTNTVRGASQTITFSAGFTSTVYTMYWRVWIDYNKNGVFTDAGEQVVSTTFNGAGNKTGTFTIPTTALLGTTRMRVSAKYGAYPTSCETFTYGEVEDYTINITATAQINALARVDGMESQDNSFLDFNSNDVTAYPNPVTDIVTIRLNYNTIDEPKKVKMTTANGFELGTKEVILENNEFKIDTKGLKTGMYFISVQEADKQKVVKIIKE
ncbi:putative secreted protein (Por secretion system target) [Arcicella aurantiaca]|uniref:carboxypeptidase T n=1 Tax=Arcicella aurantiaca TaxID=591202 RepID=A0A316E907_9BACT|nr:M14 family zinc carboxypeptidase [Arcicella aurantiaca]PWK26849.1 putative secreted protein (Por secretion system target) [Arcicella aurantiaca]